MDKPKVKITTGVIVRLGLLIAMEVVLSRFLSIQAWNIKIGFAFIPVVVAAMYYGPVAAGIVGAVSDFLGALIFPIGTYFPGFTFTAFLIGIIFGLFIYKEQSIKRITLAVVINQIFCSLIINTYWIHTLYGSPYIETAVSRLLQCGVLTAVQIAVTYKLATALMPALKSALANNKIKEA